MAAGTAMLLCKFSLPAESAHHVCCLTEFKILLTATRT